MTSDRRTVAASLLAMSLQIGCVRGDGMVFLPAPLAEVSAQSGRRRNCGTVYHHVRALGEAVRRVPGQTGMLVDVTALQAIADDSPTPNSPRSVAWSDRRGPHRAASALAGGFDPPVGALDDPTPLGEVSELVGLVRDVVALVCRLVERCDSPEVDELGGEVDRLTAVADGPRAESRTVRDLADHPRLGEPPDQREGGREGGVRLKVLVEKLLPPSLTSASRSARSAKTSATPRHREWSRADRRCRWTGGVAGLSRSWRSWSAL